MRLYKNKLYEEFFDEICVCAEAGCTTCYLYNIEEDE